MINVSNSTSKDNPLRLAAPPTGPTRPSGPPGFARGGQGMPVLLFGHPDQGDSLSPVYIGIKRLS